MSATRGSDAWPLGGGAATRGRPRGMGRGLAAIMAVDAVGHSRLRDRPGTGRAGVKHRRWRSNFRAGPG